MKYKSISLNGTYNYQYSLVRYEKKYNIIIKQLKNLNADLLDSVLQCPIIYSEESDHQAYMIVRDVNEGVGATYIATSTDEKDLEVTLQLDEDKFDNEVDMYKLINQLVDSLGRYFYDKESVYINLVNKLDLSIYNSLKYKREVHYIGIDTYCCNNKKYNKTIPLLLKEIKSCEDTLVSWKQTWWQRLKHVDLIDWHDLYDEGYIDENGYPKKYGYVPIDELFNKVDTVFWTDINSNTVKRGITFNVDGDVKFSRRPKKKGISYEFEYNVRKGGFVFKNSDISIIDNFFETKIETKNGEVIKSKEKGTKTITYSSGIVDKSSIYTEVRLADNDDIDKCYIDFRTHRNNGKINGMYLIRINNRDKNFSFSYRTRKGDICKYIDNIYYDDESFSMDTLNNRIEFFIDTINSCYRNGRGAISSDIDISDLVNTEKDVVNFMKQIKSEIPLPYLQEQIDKFIGAKKSDKVKKLQWCSFYYKLVNDTSSKSNDWLPLVLTMKSILIPVVPTDACDVINL